MVRRTFVTGSSLSVLAALMSEASDVSGKALKQPGPSPLQLTKLNQSEHVRAVYNGSKGPGSASVPYVYAYYDVKLNKFINPLDITPTKVTTSPSAGRNVEPKVAKMLMPAVASCK